MATWTDAEGRRIERHASPGPVILRLADGSLLAALATTLEVRPDPPAEARLVVALDRSVAYALGQRIGHPGLVEDALLRADPRRPVTLEWRASARMTDALAALCAGGPPDPEALAAPGDGGYPAVLDLGNYVLAAVSSGTGDLRSEGRSNSGE